MDIRTFPFHLLQITWDKSKLSQMHLVVSFIKKTKVVSILLKYIFSVCISSLQLLEKVRIVPVLSLLYPALRKSLSVQKASIKQGHSWAKSTCLDFSPSTWSNIPRVPKCLDASVKLRHMKRILQGKRKATYGQKHCIKMHTDFKPYFWKALPHKGLCLSVKNASRK